MAGATSISEDLTCAVCLDLFTRPRVLRCMHTYCHNCMVSLVRTGNQQRRGRVTSYIECPECRCRTNLDDKGVDGLSTNFALSKVVETYRTASDQEANAVKVACSVCEDANKFAVKTCVDCPNISYCEGCLSLFHPPRGVFKKHKLVNPVEGGKVPSPGKSVIVKNKLPSIESLKSVPTNKDTATVSISVSPCPEVEQYHIRCMNPNTPHIEEVVSTTFAGTDSSCMIGGLRHESVYLVTVAAEYKDGTSSFSEEKLHYTGPKIKCEFFMLDAQDKHDSLNLAKDQRTVAHCNSNRFQLEVDSPSSSWDTNLGISADRSFSEGSLYWEVLMDYQVIGHLRNGEVFASFGICDDTKFCGQYPLFSNDSCVCVVVFKPAGSSQVGVYAWDGPHRNAHPCTVLSPLNRKPNSLRFGFFLHMDSRFLKIILPDSNYVLETITDLDIDDALPVCSVGDPDVVAVKLNFVTGLYLDVPSSIAD